jgi:tetratricopeptide (TPR) repeat protein
VDRSKEAERRFDEVVALCTKAEDWLHLGAAFANRSLLKAREALDRPMADLRRAIQLAREVGNPWSERIATYNVAELLHWRGEADEALVLARRARMLEERFIERPIPDSALLIGRIQVARGDYDEARRLADWIAQTCPPDASEV